MALQCSLFSSTCARKGGIDAATEEFGHRDSGIGAAGSALGDPVVARRHLHRQSEGEEGSASQAAARSRSSTRIEEQEGMMAKAEEPWTQLATRIPKDLHRRLKLHCVTHEVTLMTIVVEAIEEKLGRGSRRSKGTR
jgi:hypothetical protein